MTSKPKRKSSTHWWDLTPEQREEAVKEFDKPLPRGRTKPLSKKQRLLWERANASKPDVSIFVHDGRADVVIRLDDQLLERAREFARKKRTSLPKMIDQGLRGLLAFAG
jgi:hypothetical protein